MKRRLIVIYVVGALLSWPVIVGIDYHGMQGIWLEGFTGERGVRLAQKHSRRHFGQAILIGALYATVWPVGLPTMFFMSGFAEHGIWRQRYRDEAQDATTSTGSTTVADKSE